MEMVPLEKLVPYVNNARTHSPEQVNKLRASLREFGFVNPVIIDKDYGIIAGHGRVMAAREEHMDEVPCVLVDYLTEAQKKAYILADNRFALDAGWDEEMLRVEVEALQGEDFDISLTGFDEKELSDLFEADAGDGQEDGFDVDEELQKPCLSQEGDLWHLGRHAVICGDSTLPKTYQRLLAGAQVNLVCTDPPYLVNLESTSGKIKNDDLSDEEGYKFLKGAFSCMHDSMAKDASIYEKPIDLGKILRKVDIKPKTSEAAIYADGQAIDAATNTASYDLTFDTAALPLEYEAYIFGHAIENGVMVISKDDVAPYFAVMFQADKRNGKTRFTKFYKVQFTEPSQSGNTKEESIKYDTPTISAKAIYRLSDGNSSTKADEEATGFAAETAANWYQSV